MRPKCQEKWADQTLDQAFGLPEVLVAVSTSRLSCKRPGKTRTLMPVWDSSGESRLMRQRTQLINALRAHLAELGIVAAQGREGIKEVLTIVAREEGVGLSRNGH